MEEQYLKESLKSYQKCQVVNSARRNSLMKKTINFERQRKLTSHQMDKEERQLREQLKHMKIEQTKNSISSGARGGAAPKKSTKTAPPENPFSNVFVDPYPVTFGGHSPSVFRQRSFTTNHTDDEGMKFVARRGRRVSKEFEDLSINTSTGQLAIPAHLLRHRSKNSSRSPTSSGSQSPSTPRRGLSGSVSSLDSSEHPLWAGDPEAIHSVRRLRKSVGQQDREKLMKRKQELGS